MQDPRTPSAGDGHRVRTAETWDAARSAYLAGEAAQAVCDRFDLGLSAFRDRARREGWRRADMPDPGPDDDLDDDSPLPSREEMMDMLWRIAARALRRGRTAEAQRCLSAHARLAEQARADQRTAAAARTAEHKGAAQRIRALGQTVREIQAGNAPAQRRPSPPELHQLHQLHPDSGAGPDPAPPDRPLTRAERRRLEKLGRKR